MKILIDCRFWGPKDTGLGIYTQNLVTNLSLLDSKNSYILLANGNLEQDFPTNFFVKVTNIRPYTLAEQFFLPIVLYQQNVELIHFTSINVPILYFGKYLLTVHDLIKHYSKGPKSTTKNHLIYWLKFYSYLLIFKWSVNFSKKIVTPTKAVKNELINKFHLPDKKIEVTHEAANLKANLKPALLTFSLPESFAVYTGNAYPHKNLDKLVVAWKTIYQKTKTKLVLIGARNVFTDRLKTLIVNNNASEYIINLGYIPDAQLVTIYKRASIYVFPSLLEGFGLPGLDAMLYGLPVVCSKIPALVEVYGDACEYFDPNSIEDMSEKIINLLENQILRIKLIKKGKEVVNHYSWMEMARLTSNLYESCNRLRPSE